MADFIVPKDLAPGAVLPGHGLVQPGRRVGWIPERAKANKPNPRLIPCDRDAYDLLVKSWGAEKVLELHGEFVSAKPVEQSAAVEPVMTPAEASIAANPAAAVSAEVRKGKGWARPNRSNQ